MLDLKEKNTRNYLDGKCFCDADYLRPHTSESFYSRPDRILNFQLSQLNTLSNGKGNIAPSSEITFCDGKYEITIFSLLICLPQQLQLLLKLTSPQDIAINYVRTCTFKKTQMVANVYLLLTNRCIVK